MADNAVSPFSLNRVAPIQLYLERQFQENAVRTEEQVYQRSIELEPRETEAVRVTRYVCSTARIVSLLTRLRPVA